MIRAALLLLLSAALAGCWGSSEDELRRWMDDVRKQTKSGVEPLPEPKRFVPRPYDARATVDPFDPGRSVVALDRQQRARAGASAVRPDLDRPREPLESLPLEQIRMVGYLRSRAGSPIGLVDPGTGTTQIRVGQYMGQNFGLVTGISETEISLKEIVQDASGEWVERPAKLELQGGTSSPSAGGKR
ncbi:MAG: pilus assembly protein PilP [Burkholderiales bacterium]|jgi:type IV pilus assembly protein PilP|nr:pilus assembly protein PilP [Burkholderiales bacterium]